MPAPAPANTGAAAGDPLDRIRAVRRRAGVFVDFDGTLSEITAHPDAAVAVGGAAAVLSKLAGECAIVAVVTGRPAGEVRAKLDVRGMQILGHYGLEPGAGDPATDEQAAGVRRAVESAAGAVAGAWVEDKGPSLAVHYRASASPGEAAAVLRPLLQRIAADGGLRLLEGKMVLEVVPADTPGKGTAVAREARARRLEACLFAGDDVADLEAFRALDELAAGGIATLRVAVDGPETPADLRAAADEVVDGPPGLVRLLERLSD